MWCQLFIIVSSHSFDICSQHYKLSTSIAQFTHIGTRPKTIGWKVDFEFCGQAGTKNKVQLTLVQKLHNYSGWKASRKASHLLLLKSFKLTETFVEKRSSSVSWGGGRRKYIISCHFDRWHVCKLYVKRLKIRYDYCHFTSITICDFVITW